MKVSTPDIMWHGRFPVFSVDSTDKILVTGGSEPNGTGGVKVWNFKQSETDGSCVLEFSRDLVGHQLPVNCVRISGVSSQIASGSVDGVIAVWRQEPAANNEWKQYVLLRGHVSDICDLCWSPNGMGLVSGSVDNSAIVWTLSQHEKVTQQIKEHKHYVLGVAWDPLNKYLLTASSDKSAIVHPVAPSHKKSSVSVSTLKPKEPQAPTVDFEGSFPPRKEPKIFLDDTAAKTTFRRPCWSPDGNFFIVPTGVFPRDEPPQPPPPAPTSPSTAPPTTEKLPPLYTSYVFSRLAMNRPLLHLPCGEKYSVAVRFCPIPFALRHEDTLAVPDGPSPYQLSYRLVFAVATTESIFLYDTQCFQRPIAFVSGIHYAQITDISWSLCGTFLFASSEDGYVTIITFGKDELGTVAEGDLLPSQFSLSSSRAIPLPPTDDVPLPRSISVASAYTDSEQRLTYPSLSTSSTSSATSSAKRRITPTLVNDVEMTEAQPTVDEAASKPKRRIVPELVPNLMNDIQ